MPWLRSRRSLRFIVGDQHNTTSATRELGFGPRKRGAPTGLAQRASPPLVALSPRTVRLTHHPVAHDAGQTTVQ